MSEQKGMRALPRCRYQGSPQHMCTWQVSILTAWQRRVGKEKVGSSAVRLSALGSHHPALMKCIWSAALAAKCQSSCSELVLTGCQQRQAKHKASIPRTSPEILDKGNTDLCSRTQKPSIPSSCDSLQQVNLQPGTWVVHTAKFVFGKWRDAPSCC